MKIIPNGQEKRGETAVSPSLPLLETFRLGSVV